MQRIQQIAMWMWCIYRNKSWIIQSVNNRYYTYILHQNGVCIVYILKVQTHIHMHISGHTSANIGCSKVVCIAIVVVASCTQQKDIDLFVCVATATRTMLHHTRIIYWNENYMLCSILFRNLYMLIFHSLAESAHKVQVSYFLVHKFVITFYECIL